MWRFDRGEGPKPSNDDPKDPSFRPSLQDPTTCQAPSPTPTRVPLPWTNQELVLAHRGGAGAN